MQGKLAPCWSQSWSHTKATSDGAGRGGQAIVPCAFDKGERQQLKLAGRLNAVQHAGMGALATNRRTSP